MPLLTVEIPAPLIDAPLVLGGRTYPLEGAAVPLPQHAPYTDPLEIFVCGGSTSGGGFAIDNCVRSAPEAENPEWIIERMVSHFFGHT